MFEMRKSKYKKLLRIISDERSCLIGGRASDLIQVSTMKKKALADILWQKENLTEPELVHLKAVCVDVERLYAATNEGLKSAHRRLQTLREPADSSKIYDASGRPIQVLFYARESAFEKDA